MDENEAMATAHRARLHALVGDLFAPPVLRLNDRERALMKGALVALARNIIADARQRLQPARRSEADDAARDETLAWTVVARCRALRSLSVAEALRTLCDMHALGLGLADQATRLVQHSAADGDAALLDRDDPERTHLIDAYHWALAQRLDAFGNPVLAADDLPEAEARALYWSVIAGLAVEKPQRVDTPAGQDIPQIVSRWQRARDALPSMSTLALGIVRGARAQDITRLSLGLLASGAVDLWIAALADRLEAPQRSLTRLLAARRMDLFHGVQLAAGIEPGVAATLSAQCARALDRTGAPFREEPELVCTVEPDVLLTLLRADQELTDARLDFHDHDQI